ncbi:hypothetical protein BK816_08605 [Boudabousia tangfeifanii]|uniref:Nudix hydrolase domain-containing protein n=1 Tax=Boudabousia tangfeifanii TaxID=1912795 RepID=A0A1D9MMQ3_9ACTO|nr:hypothetical protein BK816_08605 [Boudabousia tangfeifanii]
MDPNYVPTSADEIEVLLVHRPRYNDWSWPKGKAEPGEHILAAAVREVEEETGCVVTLGAPMTTQRYRLGSGLLKEVYYWVGRVLHSEPIARTRVPAAQASLREIDETKWVSPAKAAKMLTRRGDRRLLDDLVARLENGTLCTQNVVLLRHSKAMSRDRWSAEDASRPLARSGVLQSRDLIDLLSAYGVEQVYTSPWQRCASTVRPYAAIADLPLQLLSALTEDAHRQSPATSAHAWQQVLTKQNGHRVVCVHRPTLPDLLAVVADIANDEVRRQLQMNPPSLRTAEMLVFHVAQPNPAHSPVVIAAERHRPAKIGK